MGTAETNSLERTRCCPYLCSSSGMAAELARKARSAFNSAIDDFGTLKISDPSYQDSYGEVEEVASNVRELATHLDELYRCVEALGDAQKMVAQDMRKLYKGDPTAADAVKDYIRSTRNLAVDLPGRMLPSLQKSVVGSADKWSHRLQDVLSEAASDTINESYKKYMHYKEKVSKMAQEKRSGKLTSSSQQEAYARNQDKLSSAKQTYMKHRDKVIEKMDSESAIALDESNKILLRMLQFTQAYYQQGAEAVVDLGNARSAIDNLVKNPPERARKVRQSAEAGSDVEDGSDDGSDSAEEYKKPSKKTASLDSSEDDDDDDFSRKKKSTKKKSSKKSSGPAEDSLMAFENAAPAAGSASPNDGSLSPRTAEWQRKNEQRVLMGLPPKEHPEGPGYVAARMGQQQPQQQQQQMPQQDSQDLMISSQQPQQNSTDDLLASFGSLDMSAQQPAQQPVQQQPGPQQPFGQPVGNVFQQQQPFQQMPMGMQQGYGGMQQPMQPMGMQPQQMMGMQQQQQFQQQQQQQQPFQPFQ